MSPTKFLSKLFLWLTTNNIFFSLRFFAICSNSILSSPSPTICNVQSFVWFCSLSHALIRVSTPLAFVTLPIDKTTEEIDKVTSSLNKGLFSSKEKKKQSQIKLKNEVVAVTALAHVLNLLS